MKKEKKIKLYSIGNAENFNYYIFDKKEEVIERLMIIFSKISMVDWHLHDRDTNKKRNVNKLKDIHEMEGVDKKFRVDVFYGDKKMFVIVHCSQKDRLIFNEELAKISQMVKYKHPANVKKIKDKNLILGDFKHKKKKNEK